MTATVDLSTRGGRLRAMLAVTPGATDEVADLLGCTTTQVHARLSGDTCELDGPDIVGLSDILTVPIPWITGEAPNPLQVLVRLQCDALTPTQELAMEVLAARHRRGESAWTFEPRMRSTLRALEEGGLVHGVDGHTAGPVAARLSSAGRLTYLSASYTTPADHLRERLETERAETEQVWATLRVEQQTNRALRALLAQYESGARPSLIDQTEEAHA